MAVDYAAELPTYITNLADTVVQGGYQTFMQHSLDALNAAYTAFGALNEFYVGEVPTNVEFHPVGAPGTFNAPPVPDREIPTLEIPPEPGNLSLTLPTLRNTAGAIPPEPNLSQYEFQMPTGQPGPLTALPPLKDYVLDTVVIPDAPTDEELTVDDVSLIPMPSMPPDPDIDEVEFEGEPPQIDFSVPDETFAFSEDPFSSELLDLVKSKIAVIAEGTGLTPAQELASFEQAKSREDKLAQRALQEEDEKFSAKGWSIPNGILAKQLRIIRHGNQDASLAHSRKVELDNKLLMIDSLKTAIAQGIACTQMEFTGHLAIEERRFQSAKFAHEAMLSIFNARIALYNARVQMYQTDAQVFRDRIQAELTKVEIYKAQIDGLRAVGETNKVLVDQYVAQITATNLLIERYKTGVEAAEAVSRVNLSRIEGYRARVQAYAEVVRAYGTEWEAYKTKVEAEKGKIEAGDVAARIYNTRMQGWTTKRNADFETLRAELSVENLKKDAHDADVRVFLGLLEAQKASVQAEAQALSAEAQVYAAAGQIAQAESAATDRSYQLEIAKSTTHANLHLKNGEIRVNQALQRSAQMLEAKRAMAQTTAQLAASSMSAINISGQVGVSGTASMSYQNSISYNYQGDAP